MVLLVPEVGVAFSPVHPHWAFWTLYPITDEHFLSLLEEILITNGEKLFPLFCSVRLTLKATIQEHTRKLKENSPIWRHNEKQMYKRFLRLKTLVSFQLNQKK